MEENIFKSEETQIENEIQLRVKAELEKLAKDPYAIIKAYQEVVKQKDYIIEAMSPKVDFYDTVTQTEDWMEMSTAVKLLGFKNWGRNKVFELLRTSAVLRENNEPYQKYVDREYFKVVEVPYTHPNTGESYISRKTVVSQTGLDYVRKLIGDNR